MTKGSGSQQQNRAGNGKAIAVRKSRRFQSHLIALEPRMMFDGAAVPTAGFMAPPIDSLTGDNIFRDQLRIDRFLNVSDNPGLETSDLAVQLGRLGPAPVLGPNAASAVSSTTSANEGRPDTGNRQALDRIDVLPVDDPLAPEARGGGEPILERPAPIFGRTDLWIDDLARISTDRILSENALVDAARPLTASPANIFIFIDTNVVGYEQLASEWSGRGTVVLIDGNRDGVDQMRAALAGVSDIDAIHIVSHGDDGVFWLGTTQIDQSAVLGNLASSFAAIGAKLSAHGDILIYGCDVGSGFAGQGLMDSLALTTGADIAASVDDTGAILRGGDWTLENRLGVIDNATLASRDWEGLLAPAPLRGIAANLTVRDANGNPVTISGGGQSAAVGAGATARWTNVATINGVQVDLVARIDSTGSASDVVRFNRSGTNNTLNDDFGLLLQTSGTTGTATAVVTWSIVRTGTNTPVQTDVTFTVADIDGVGGVPLSRESVVVSTDTLSSYQNAAGSRVSFINSAGAITAAGTQDESGAAESGARFNWLNTSSFTITYQLNRANGLTNQALFNHDGDLDFNLGSGGVTVSIPRLDLDGNDSTAPGSGYRATFTENGAAVRIVDSDVVITNPVGSIVNATITLTNAQAGDQLLVNGSTAASGTLAGGISYTITGGNVIQLTGASNAANYAAALQAITFRNTTERPATVDRNITVGFANSTLNSNVATSTIRVIEINDPPQANIDGPFATDEDRPLNNINVLGNDTDADGDPLRVTAASAVNGQVTINVDGTLNYTPNLHYFGTDTITYTISDGRGGTSTATVRIDIPEIADDPTNDVPGAQTIDEDQALVFSVANNNRISITDPDGGNQTVTITVTNGTFSLSGITGLTFTEGDGTNDGTMTFSGDIVAVNAALLNSVYRPNADYNGPAQIRILTRNDPIANTGYVNGSFEQPGIGANAFRQVNENTVPGWDTDATDNLIEIWGSGFQGVPAQDGINFVELNATQASTLFQNVTPGRGNALDVSFAHRGRVGVDVMQLRAVDLGADGVFGTTDDQEIFRQTFSDGNTAWGQYNVRITDSSTGNAIRLEYTAISSSAPDTTSGNFIDNIVLTQRPSDVDTIDIVVRPVADIVNDSATTLEDTPVSFSPLANDSFEAANPLITRIDGQAITAGGPAVTVANGSVTLNSAGELTFTPTANYNGTTSFTYTVQSGGVFETATATITVTPVNDAPVLGTTLGTRTGVDGTSASFPTFAGFRDPDGDPLAFSATGLPAGFSIDPATGVVSGTFAPDASQINGGVYAVTVTATDPGGLSVSQTFNINVTNPGPTANNDIATTAEDTPVTIPVLANDSDPDGDALSVVAASAVNGTVVRNADGTITYTPNANFNGTDTITYTISDGQGGTSTATVAVTVTPVNDAPVRGNILSDRVGRDGAPAGYSTINGFRDPDGDPLAFSATGLPAGFSIDPATGVVSGTFAPDASQINGGVYAVTVTATDPGGLSVSQTFNINVTNPGPTANNDIATTAEDTPVTIPVLANDSDPDGDALSVVAASAANGTVVRNADGTITYTPNPNFNGTDTITYTISDGQGGTSTATVAVTVTPVNDAPVTTPIATVDTSDSATVSVPVAPNFSDPDGDTLNFSVAGLPPGLTINPTTGVISGTISANASQTNGGVYTATITASDGKGGTVQQTITFNVTNPPPVATDDSVTTPEDTPVRISPLVNDSDPDGDPLTITSAKALKGSVVINADGTITYTPNPGFNGSDRITYTISDGQGGTATATVAITVTDVNDVPIISGTIANQTNLDSQVINLPVAAAFSDPDGDPLVYTATGLPAGLTINPSTGVISGTISRSASQVNGGAYSITVTASDGRGGSVNQTFSWTVTNPAPGAVNDTATTNEDTPVRIPVLANDLDPDGDPLTVTQANAGNGTVSINPDGSLLYTPNANFNGTDTILYRISDGEGGFSTASVTVTVRPVNDAPTTVGLPNQNGDDGTAVSFSVASAFSDPDGDTLTFSATGLPPNLVMDSAGNVTGVLDPSTSQGGPYVVTVTATDPSGATVTTSFVYSVQNVPPVARDDTAATPEDTPVRVAVLTNDSDPDGDPLTITSASATNGTVVVNADGTLTFTPNPNFNGIATVSYAVSDGNGGIATATLTVTVGAVNDAPTALPIPDQASVDGAFYSAGVAPFFSDVDGDTLTFSATGLPAGLSIDPATGVVSGTIDRNASQVNGGVYTVTITANDGNGGTVNRTLTATITNPAPTATNDSATTAEDTPIPAINVLANDTDPDGDPLTVTAASASNGTVTINPDGTLRYVPKANFNGTDTITYTISDGNGGTSTAAVTVTVTPVNDPPVTVNDTVTTNEDQPVTIGVLGNDSDVDGDPLTVTSATSPDGTVVINPDGTITFTPNANFNGPTTIVYSISDGNGGVALGTVIVTVAPVNDAPVANPSTATTNEDTSVNVAVLANDSDVDGDPLTVTSANAPNGTVVINPDGTVTYTPNANFNGTDTITYTISDGKGGFSTSTVTVTVAAVNDAPVLGPVLGTRTGVDGTSAAYSTINGFRDPDGDTLTFSASGLPAGFSINPSTGLISGTFAPDASQINGGVYAVTVTATDPGGQSVSQTFNIIVSNPAPTANNDAVTTAEDIPVTIPVLANDSDPDGDPLSVVSAAALHGSVVINPDGTIAYTPNANFNGTDTITYTISDGNGGTSTATVAVTVTAVNDAPERVRSVPDLANVDGTNISLAGITNFFRDPDGDPLTFSASGLPPGLSINPTNGNITGSIDRNASQTNGGIYNVVVTATDPGGLSVTQTFTWTITNPVPTANNDTATTAEDTPVIINVLANDSDPDGDPLTVTSATSANGSVVINPDGTLTFTPNANFNGPATIVYSISDGNGGVALATVNVNVTPVNDAPTAAPIPPQTNVDAAIVNLPVAGNFADLDGDTLSFSATGLPAGLSINPSTGVISGTIDRAASQVNGGVYTVSVAASDGNGGTVTTVFSWTVTNPPPVANNDSASTNEDTPVTIAVLTNDSDPDGDPLTVASATSPDGTVVINPDGTITFTPNADFNGATTITYSISDGNGGIALATVNVNVIPVNDAPTASPLPAQNNVDSAVINVATAGNFADLDGDTLSYAATGLPPGLTINPATGVISGIIAANASQTNGGLYSVTVTASDGNGGTASSTFSWTVTNPAPTAANDIATTNEDTQVIIAVLANDNDPDGDPLTVTAASSPNGTVTINPDGTLSYTPDPDFNGTDTITYTISDGNGGASTATVTVTVTPVNDAPRTNGLPDLFDIDNNVVSVPVGPAFTDAEGDTLTFSASGLPAGLSINAATGEIFGQIASNASTIGGGIYTVTITANDGNGGITSTTFTWTITNTAPLASDDIATTAEDTPVTINVLGNDTDPDLDPLTVVSATATNGSVVINADGTVTFTPDANFNGTATVSYLITDGNGGFSTATAVITVTPVNDAPTVSPLPDRSNVGGAVVSVAAGSQFTDIDGDTLSFSATGLPAGLVINPATGTISGTIAPGASQVNGGVYLVTVTADDGNGGTVSSTFVWTISNVAPQANNDSASTSEDTPVTIAVLTNDVDPDGDPLSVTLASAVNGTVVINADGTITYTPDNNFNGTDTITYTISDGNGGTATATVTVTVAPQNDAPTVTPLPARSNPDSSVVNLSVAGNFDDLDGDTLSFSATGLPPGLSIDAAGNITGTIAANASQGAPGGVYSVTVTANDGNGGTVSTTFSWTVTNPPPVAVNDGPIAATEDTPIIIPVLANDSDPDGDPLTVTAATSPNGTVVINPDGSLTFTPASNFNGPTTISYTISDGNGGTANATVSINVAAVNDAPVSTPLAPRTNTDGTTVSVPVASHFSDVDNASLAFSATGLPAGLSIDPATGVISGTIDRNASQPAGGVYSVTVTATDAGGLTTSQTFNWTVTNPPPIAVNDVASTPEDFPVNINVLANDSDPDGDTLSVTTASAANGTVVIQPNGTIGYTPGPNFNGVDTITYTISDGNGGTATATVTVTVGAVDDPPVATDDTASTNEDTPVTIRVLANDTDIDGDPLTVTAATSPNGAVAINPDGTITFTPAVNFNGVTTITYTVSDGQGGFDTAVVTVVVNPVDDPPVAVNDSAATSEDTPVTVNVLANDSDVDGDRLTVTSATSPNGAVTINPDGTITFTPAANFNGPTTISYTISDGKGGTATATVTVTVAAVNDAPVANPSTATTNEDTPVNLPVLANDTDVDGDPLTVTAVSAANGTVTINPDGTVRYVPNPNFNGTDTVTYTISDGRGGTSTSTVTVTVNPVNDVPVANNDNATTAEDSPVTIPVLGNDTDADGNPLTITSATSPNGTVAINPDGTITFTPNPNFNGPATITYTISDGQGGTATATVAVNVTPVNDPPVAVNDIASGTEDTPLRISPLTNDSDVDGNPLTIVSATSPNGTVTINPDGTITFVPDPNFNGPTTITYQISDGQGGFSTATINVNVAAVNDPPVAANDVFNMDEDTTARIPVLSNDSDVDGDPLTITQASSPNGTVVINPDGTISFTPAPNFFGPATITYTVSDGRGGTATATVTVKVRNTDEPPVDGDETITTIGGVDTRIDVLANATDPDGDRLSVIFAEVADGQGTVTINADGTLNFIAPQDFDGVATIVYLISDGRGGFDFSIVTVNVTQAAADINALLGVHRAGIPDGWLVDEVRNQESEFIEVPLIIDKTVNEFRALNPIPRLFGERPLLTAVNGISWLRGVGDLDFDGHPIGQVSDYIDRIRDIRFGVDRLFDPRFGDFMVKSLTGSSVRELGTGNEQLMIESVVRDRVIYMELRDVGKEGDPRIVEYQLRTRDGSPLPEWIHMDKRGLAIIERPVDADEIRLVVKAIRADGKVIEVPVVIQGSTGEIELDGKAKEVGKVSAAPLGEVLAFAQSAAADETARLLAAFKG